MPGLLDRQTRHTQYVDTYTWRNLLSDENIRVAGIRKEEWIPLPVIPKKRKRNETTLIWTGNCGDAAYRLPRQMLNLGLSDH